MPFLANAETGKPPAQLSPITALMPHRFKMFGERSRAHVRIKRRFLRDQQIDDTDITIRIARLVTDTASERIGSGTARTIHKGDILHTGQHRPLGNARLDAALD